ncbi:MAG: hypothetical protein ABI378_01695 [Chitinophagaceae bacterium]
MKNPRLFPILCTILLCLTAKHSFAQNVIKETDSGSCPITLKKQPFANNLLQQAWNSIQKNKGDTCSDDPETQVLNFPAEAFFTPFAGKIIRHIEISRLGFNQLLSDTSSRITSFAAHAATDLHATTKKWVIRNNLFQKEGSRLNPYIMADNERYLRTLDYLQDARIFVRSVPESPDSVDLYIVTKDVFSIKLVIDNDGYNAGRARLSENNFLGMGQRIQGTMLYNNTRDPKFGYGFEYNKNNIGGTFINGNLSYNNIDIGRSLGYEPEAATSLLLLRPLPSPYDYYAGGLEISTNKALNVYRDTGFYAYTYNIYDLWGGYNLSLHHIMTHDSSIRDRKFLSLRYFQQKFIEGPASFQERFDPVYNDIQAILAQLTFFKQNFIKTQYIYGFGITEDVPYGYNVSVTGGWWKQRGLERPYAGFVGDYYTTNKNGAFCQYYLRTGGFLDGGKKLDDATFMLGLSRFSRLFFARPDVKIRLYFRATYARIFNPLTYEPLRINNTYGLRDFGSDSAQGNERISAQTETIFYTRYKPLGFRLAPFVFVDGALLRTALNSFRDANFYSGFGGGIRMRNENLIFGTIEIKAGFFPRNVPGQASFKFLISSELRYRYQTTYIHAPDIVRLNTDNW